MITLALHHDHLAELGLRSLGAAAAEVTLPAFGADDLPAASHPEALGS